DDPAGRQLAERRQAVRRHRRDPVGRHQDAGADRDAPRVGGGERHGDEDVSAEQLRVVEPRMREAELLGALDRRPGVGGGSECDPEVHAAAYLSLARNPVSLGKAATLVPATLKLAQSEAPGVVTMPGWRVRAPAATPAASLRTAGVATMRVPVGVAVLRLSSRNTFTFAAADRSSQVPPVSTRTSLSGMVKGESVPSA